MIELGIKQNMSNAYISYSHGVLERFHRHLYNMMWAYFCGQQKDWDESISMKSCFFAIAESVQKTLGFRFFELVSGRQVCLPLKILQECWLTEEDSSTLLEQISKLSYRMTKARKWLSRKSEWVPCSHKSLICQESISKGWQQTFTDFLNFRKSTPGKMQWAICCS